MYESILRRIREKVQKLDYVVTYHARKEMLEDGLSIIDVESIILSGRITERQKDKNTGERKYRIVGDSIRNIQAETIVKFSASDKLVIITVYAL